MRNQWVCWSGHIIMSQTRPRLCPCGDDHIEPLVPKYRIHGISYTPYRGTTEWERAANEWMADITAARFRGRSQK